MLEVLRCHVEMVKQLYTMAEDVEDAPLASPQPPTPPLPRHPPPRSESPAEMSPYLQHSTPLKKPKPAATAAGATRTVRFQTPPPRKKQCGLCPEWCYDMNCTSFNCVFTALAFLASAGTFIGLMCTIVRPHLFVLTYTPGNCTTVNYTWTGERERCACTKPWQKNCLATFPCLVVRVKYVGRDGKLIISMLHEEEHVFSFRPHCSFQPKKCNEGYNPNAVSAFFDRYGIPGKKYPCYHSPVGPGALRNRTRGTAYIINVIFWTSFFTVLFAILWCIVFFYCCAREPAKSRY